MKIPRSYSRYTQDAAQLLGQHIRLGRKQRHMSERDFAERVGISRATLQKIESGHMGCELGLVLEAAALAGVSLFEAAPQGLARLPSQLEGVRDRIALLPKSVRKPPEVDDDF